MKPPQYSELLAELLLPDRYETLVDMLGHEVASILIPPRAPR